MGIKNKCASANCLPGRLLTILITWIVSFGGRGVRYVCMVVNSFCGFSSHLSLRSPYVTLVLVLKVGKFSDLNWSVKKILKFLYNSGERHSWLWRCNHENITVKLVEGLQFALSLLYLACGCANSVASLTSSLSPSPIQSFWAHGPSRRPWGRETWAPRLPHPSKGSIACTFLGPDEKYEVLRKPEQGLAPGAEGPGARAPGAMFGSRLCHLLAAGSAQSLHLQNMLLLLRSVVRIRWVSSCEASGSAWTFYERALLLLAWLKAWLAGDGHLTHSLVLDPGCKGEQAGFPGSRGACRGWGERVCLGALCTVAVDVPFVTGEILGFFFFRILVG